MSFRGFRAANDSVFVAFVDEHHRNTFANRVPSSTLRATQPSPKRVVGQRDRHAAGWANKDFEQGFQRIDVSHDQLRRTNAISSLSRAEAK